MSEVNPKTNIFQIRKNSEDVPLQTIEDSITEAKRVREELAQDLTEVTMEQAMGFLTGYGILREMHKVDGRDLIMLENAIQAILYRYYGLEHPLHEVTEEVFEFNTE